MAEPPDVTILLVEDDPADARYVERLLTEYDHDPTTPAGHIAVDEVIHVDRLSAARDVTEQADVVLLDLMLPDSGGLDTVDAMIEHAPAVPIVVLTGETAADMGVTAIRKGAQDYLVKGSITDELLVRSIRYAIERAATLEELEHHNHRLKLLNRIVSAELQTDVSMIIGRGDQLRSAVDGEQQAILEDLLAAAEHTLELTKTAEDLSTALSGDIATGAERVDLREIVSGELTRLRDTAEVDLTVESEQPAEPVWVQGHPLLSSACRELLVNATSHTDRSTATVTVTLSTTADEAVLEIADDGIGMSATQRERINNPDERLEDDTGLGAGLYLVTTVVEAIDGTLSVAENEPQGTVVTVRLDRVSE